MLNEISPSVFDNKYCSAEEIKEDDYLLCYKDNKILLKKSKNSFEIPCRSDFKENIHRENAIYLFSLNSNSCFLLNETPVDNGVFIYQELSLPFLRNFPLKEISWIGILGFQMMNWYSNNKFCGKCGSRTIIKKDERAIACPDCNNVIFLQIPPAVIVAIICKNKILLAKGKHSRGDFYALIAGYVDIGESLEEAVAREVKEEIGIEINNIRYYESQPWPFSGSMMIGYTAEADDGQLLKLDQREIAEAGWFARGNLPAHAPNISITGDMIDAFEKGII